MQLRAAFFAVCNFLLVIVALQSCQCIQMVRPVILKEHLVEVRHKHFDLYVSSDFDADEVNLVEEAAQEWQDKTKQLITFNIFLNFDTKDYSVIKNKKEALVIVRLSKDSKWVRKVDGDLNPESGARIVGYYNTDEDFPTPTIVIVYDRMTGQEYFRGTCEHELGHAIGLQHLKIEHTLMYPSMDLSARQISHEDLVAFCALYYCDTSKLE